MVSQLLAGGIIILHLIFILFVLFGGFWVIRKSWLAWLHVPATLWGFATMVPGWGCPLTHLENLLREAAGKSEYSGGFIEHYLGPAVYPGGMPREAEPLTGAFVLTWNLAVYAFVFSRVRQRCSAEKTSQKS